MGISARNCFVGESKLALKNLGDLKPIDGGRVLDVIRDIMQRHGVGENIIEIYLKQAKSYIEDIAKKAKVKDYRRIKFFALELSDHIKYSPPVTLNMVKNRISYKPLQGRYLVPIRLEDYNIIRKNASKRIPIFGGEKRISIKDFISFVRSRGGSYNEDVLIRVAIGYNMGKHLLLVGPPGVGKSFLAKLLADYLGYELHSATASSTWTRYDFIGGPRIVKGRLVWRSGLFLKALYRHIKLSKEGGGKKGVLLLIDELNRCEADKVLAEFFTMYSGIDPRYWRLPESIIDEIKNYELN